MNPADRDGSDRGSAPGSADILATDRLNTLTPGETSSFDSSTEPGASVPLEFGRYRLIRKLGQGGMGAVYYAHDTQLDRPVALKIPRFSAKDDPRILERFRLEARAAAAFLHPNLCPVYDVGQVGETHFLTMAYLEGTPLANAVKDGQPMPQVEAARLVQQIASALAYAHRRGVIHRDLKPANIMIGEGGVPVVMDFGLAHRTQQDVGRLTRAGEIMGTPAYMPPELVEGNVGAMGPGCDIYSLGVILYELITGRLPFRGSMATVLVQILTMEPEPPRTLRADVDLALSAICLKAMAKKPADRFADADQMAAALDAYLQKASATVPTPAAAAPAVAAKPTSPPPGRRRWPFGAIALAALAACVAAACIVLLYDTDYGTVKIELSDPAAQVDIKLDKSIEIAGVGDPVRLRAGEHGLAITGKNYETVAKSFSITRGKETVVKVSLTPTAKIATVLEKSTKSPIVEAAPLPAKKESAPPQAKLPKSTVRPPFDPPGDTAILSLLQGASEAHLLPGIVALVADKDKILSVDVNGYSDVAAKTPIRPDALFSIGAQTRSMTAAALMMLVDEGKVDLDDPVERFLPEFKEIRVAQYLDGKELSRKRPSRPVTVRDCLRHSSGLPAVKGDEQSNLDGAPLRELVREYAKMSLTYEPGSKMVYSSAGYIVVGRILEVVSKMPYEEFLKKRLFDPLDMRDTTFWPNEEQLRRLAKAYREGPNQDELVEIPVRYFRYPLGDRSVRYANSSVGLFSAPEDMSRFCRMMLRRGELDGKRLLSEKSVAEMWNPQQYDATGKVTNYGLGFVAYADAFGQAGWLGTEMVISVDRGLVFVWCMQKSPSASTAQIRSAFRKAAVARYAPK
jgi:CubicO group peptidase (beta-lactamase class C family)